MWESRVIHEPFVLAVLVILYLVQVYFRRDTIIQYFPGGSDSKSSVYNVGDLGSIPGSGRSPGEGNGNPRQYYCLENPMDGGAWWVTVHGVAKSQTWLSNSIIIQVADCSSSKPIFKIFVYFSVCIKASISKKWNCFPFTTIQLRRVSWVSFKVKHNLCRDIHKVLNILVSDGDLPES